MTNFVIYGSTGEARLQVRLYSDRRKIYLHANFLSLEQPAFIDALERRYELEEIQKDSHGGMWLTCRVPTDLAPTVLEDISVMLDETWRY